MPVENGGEDVQAKPTGETGGTPSTPAKPNTKPDENSAEKLEKDIKRGEWWLIRIGIATLLINTIIALIYWGQLKEMRKATRLTTDAIKIAGDTLTETQKSNAQQRLDNAAAAVDAKTLADKNATQARKSLQATIDNFHLDQRAWVSVIEISGTPQKDAPWVVTVRVRNTGKTFAKQFHMVVGVIVNGVPDFAELDKPHPQLSSSKSLITPGGEYSGKTTITGPGSLHGYANPTQEYIDELKAGKGRNYAYGKMQYTDIFGVSHWSTYCAFLNTDLIWQNCADHNDADNN